MLLAPYRVLDLCDERGQLAGQMLAQLGADVIAVEPPGGSRSRQLAPFAGDHPGLDNALYHQAWNRGKRSVVLDLAGSATDRARFLELVAGADVLFESSGTGVLAGLGLGPAELAAVNPALVNVSISAFGHTGPKAGWAAADVTVWASAGPLSLTGDVDRPPVPVGVPQAFVHGAAEAAGAALIALHERARSGHGQHIDVSAQQSAAQATQCAVLSAPNNATTHMRSSGGLKLGDLNLQLVWPCKDGHVSVTLLFGTAIGPFTRRFMEWMFEEGGCDQATLDKDWIEYTVLLLSGQEPMSEYERVKDLVTAFLADKTKAELLEAALNRSLLIASILDIADVVDNPHYEARQYWDDVDGIRHPGPMAKLSGTPLPRLGRAPHLGEHTQQVLAEPRRAPATLPEATDASASEPALQGLRVLDLMWVMAGPATSRVLADHGATVVRVESAKRVETARTLQPFHNDVPGPDTSTLFASLNAGKLGVSIDLRSDDGRTVLLDLVKWADVVLESFSPKAMRAWGLDYDTIRAVNPGVIMLSSCLFGQTGPLSSLAGFGTMASALTGFFGVTGWPDRPPCGPYGAYTDYIAPRFSTAVLLAALDHRRRTGEGQYIDFAQSEGALHALAPAILEWTVNGREWGRRGDAERNHHPHGVFAAANGEWVAVACESDDQRAALSALVGGLERADIEAWTSSRTADQATEGLQAAGVAAHAVQNSPECLDDPQLAHRGHFVSMPHAVMGTVVVEGSRAAFSRTPGMPRTAAPSIGEHTYEVLTGVLGYDDERFAELLVGGALE